MGRLGLAQIFLKKIGQPRLTLLTYDISFASGQLSNWILNYDNNYFYLYIDLGQPEFYPLDL
jgi:hypothetical protein